MASQAASLVCLEEVLMPGSDRTWPEAGASLSLELWEVWRVKTWKDREAKVGWISVVWQIFFGPRRS